METIQAKIRNKLTPFWTLNQMMSDNELWVNINSTEPGRGIVLELIQQCTENKKVILDLIDSIEKQEK